MKSHCHELKPQPLRGTRPAGPRVYPHGGCGLELSAAGAGSAQVVEWRASAARGPTTRTRPLEATTKTARLSRDTPGGPWARTLAGSAGPRPTTPQVISSAGDRRPNGQGTRRTPKLGKVWKLDGGRPERVETQRRRRPRGCGRLPTRAGSRRGSPDPWDGRPGSFHMIDGGREQAHSSRAVGRGSAAVCFPPVLEGTLTSRKALVRRNRHPPQFQVESWA